MRVSWFHFDVTLIDVQHVEGRGRVLSSSNITHTELISTTNDVMCGVIRTKSWRLGRYSGVVLKGIDSPKSK